MFQSKLVTILGGLAWNAAVYFAGAGQWAFVKGFAAAALFCVLGAAMFKRDAERKYLADMHAAIQKRLAEKERENGGNKET